MDRVVFRRWGNAEDVLSEALCENERDQHTERPEHLGARTRQLRLKKGGKRPCNCERVRERNKREKEKEAEKREMGTEGQMCHYDDLPGSVSFRTVNKAHNQPLSTSPVPSPVWCSLKILSALLLFAITSGSSADYAHFTDRERDAWRACSMSYSGRELWFPHCTLNHSTLLGDSIGGTIFSGLAHFTYEHRNCNRLVLPNPNIILTELF